MSKPGVVILSLLFLTGVASAQPTKRKEAAAPADAASVDAVVSALYAAVSHGPDASPDFDRLRRIFLYVGMLIPPKAPGEADFRVMDVDQFEERVEKSRAAQKEKGQPTGFFEREIGRRTDCFGNICQIFSAYEARRSASDATPFVRGINSIQLLRDGNRWWIASVVWDQERPDSPIPAQYLTPK
jgi:hypothetical protein